MTVALARREEAIYYKLVRQFPLRPIRSESENKRAMAICDQLTDNMDNLSQAEEDYLDLLSELIARYELRWQNEIAHMTPRGLIEYLMQQNALTQNDLVTEFGSPSRVSRISQGQAQIES